MKRNKDISIRYSTEEYEKVKAKAQALGMPISSFIRTLSLISNISTTE